MITAGTVRTGNVSSTPVVSRPIAVSAVATVPPERPACISTRPWATPPVAAPPGRTFEAALPTSCDVATAGHDVRGSARWSRPQSATKLATSSTTRTANQYGRTSSRSGQAPRSVIRLGVTTYRPNEVTTTPTVRQPHRRTTRRSQVTARPFQPSAASLARHGPRWGHPPGVSRACLVTDR